jgi:hypothetical protein
VLIGDVEMPVPYHTGNGPTRRDMRKVDPERRPFIAWDGEGANIYGNDKPQRYVLFGCSTGEYVVNTGNGLDVASICDHILTVGAANPDAWHVGFFFSYDMNMIVRTLSESSLRFLYLHGYVKFTAQRGSEETRYCIRMIRGKWISVTRYRENHTKTNQHARETVTIQDIGPFYACSFVKAVREHLLPTHPEIADALAIVEEGKTHRGSEQFNDAEYVQRYWLAEIRLMQMLAEDLRRRVYGAGFRVTRWFGPAVLADYSMRRQGIAEHMEKAPDTVREAARYAYAGGRFELFKAGRVAEPIHSLDINSAYPYAISQLPSLAGGEWHYVSAPKSVSRFGVYRVRMDKRTILGRSPAPLFHRDERHNISFPWNVEGWYWSPEVARLIAGPLARVTEVIEGWEFHPATNARPFRYIAEMYETRREWKRQGLPSQLALKLCMNSMYGKMAQTVGWDEKTGRIPKWHQLEWAGWVTSYTRSMLYGVMARLPKGTLIAVETDGIYTTADPNTLGLTIGGGLGEWEHKTFDELLYLQSGLAWLRSGDTWSPKRRGLDPDSFSLSAAQDYLRTLVADAPWDPFMGRTNRFIGLGAAINSARPLKVQHCRWITADRAISPGEHGKRVHVARACAACRAGANAYDMAHDLVIRSRSRAGVLSAQHFVPWEGNDDGAVMEWREYETTQGEAAR